RRGVPRGHHRSRDVSQGPRRGARAGAGQHHRVRQDTSIYARGARRRGRGHRAALLLGLPRHEPRGAQGLRGHPPRRHAEERARRDADPRRPLQVPRLPCLRAQARRVVRLGEKAGMNAPDTAAKPKKSVALSGVTAGNTALSTVGQGGNDLHYRGYDIIEIAESCEFEEIAYLLIHGKLPNVAELTAYKAKLRALRGLPGPVRAVLEQLPAATHPMDVLRTGASTLGCLLPEREERDSAGAREIADHLVASLGSMLCYWYHWSHNGHRVFVETDDDSVGGHFLHLLHGKTPPASWVRAMHTSLNLYAEHEFNASTFTGRVIAGTGSDIYSAITGAIGALRGPKHGGANEAAFEIQSRYQSADEAQADIKRRVENKEVVIGFGHPVYTISDPRNK